MTNEEKWIADVLGGNHDSFEPLLRPYRKGMLNVAYRLTGNFEEAKEVCQEAVIKVYKYLVDTIRKLQPKLQIGLCMEEADTFKALDMQNSIGCCNCVL